MSQLKFPNFTLKQKGHYYIGRFIAMNCPCDISIETDDANLAQSLSQLSVNEALRIEKKFSRYRDDNIVAQINSGSGKTLLLDEETNNLIHFAHIAWQQSDGLFDISSGVLRKAWNFKSHTIPSQSELDAFKKSIGWDKIIWEKPYITLRKDMQIDFGGIGKEYATDKIGQFFTNKSIPALVNLGGDIVCTAPPKKQPTWIIGLDNPLQTGQECIKEISLQQGAIATSGDARNCIELNGKRYGHIINPKTAYPVENSPRSVTVSADSCIEAGLFSTLAILQGRNAESFLKELDVPYWLVR